MVEIQSMQLAAELAMMVPDRAAAEFDAAGAESLTAILIWRARHQSNRVAYSFIESSNRTDEVTWGELNRRALAFAGRLACVVQPQGRVILALEPGIDYITAFFGCLLVGAVVVPTISPKHRRRFSVLEAIARDCEPAVLIGDDGVSREISQWSEPGGTLACLPVLAPSPSDVQDAFRPVTSGAQSIALLQYTSGSTGLPKGVILRHGNLLRNLEGQRRAYGINSLSRGVIWLPPHHDMGLNSGILQPLYVGFHITLMSPLYAMQRPLRWLQAMSDTHATISGGPTFAYAACVAAAAELSPGQLDLSHWQCAIVGAEHVNAQTLFEFSRQYASMGLRAEVFAPSYGLAEATLLVTSHPPGDFTVHQESGRALVGCGSVIEDHVLLIVDPETRRVRADGEEGEIWIAGPSVATGYWNDPVRTENVFGGRTADGRGPFLRTGDLGVVSDGELIITGRIKDIIIFAGRKLHAQDIEAAVRNVDPERLGDAIIAAVATATAGREGLLVLIEVPSRYRNRAEQLHASRSAIEKAILRKFDVRVGTIEFVRPGALPRTSSGKIRRQACRDQFMNGDFEAGAVVDAQMPQGGTARGVIESTNSVETEG